MNDSARIKCPNCAEPIDVSEVLYQQLQTELVSKYEQQYSRQKRDLEQSQKQLTEDKLNYQQQINQQVSEQVEKKQKVLESQLRGKLNEENQVKLSSLEKELQEKSDQVKQFHQLKAEHERQKREFSEHEHKIQAEMEQKFSTLMVTERQRLQEESAHQTQLKLSEKDQIIEQLRVQAEQAQRKAEQGSMQVQGEVQELAIENWLKEQFPLDSIEEIKKGARGADCLQIINTRSRSDVGKIYYESKRTKAFQPSWLEKFKQDMQNRQANIGVLVTQALPKEIERIGQIDGIWICRFQDLEGLVSVIRESLIQINRALTANQNKGDKMHMIYDYLTGAEFRMQIESMVEGFVQMKEDLERERRAMEGLWKKREKQIEKVLFNANSFYSSIRGIAGNAVPQVNQFELPDDS